MFVVLWQFVHDPGPWGVPQVRGARGLGRFVMRYRQPLAAAILTGSLPLVHAHSFGVVLGSAFFIGLAFRGWREGRWVPWAVYVVVTLLLALPQIWWSSNDSVSNTGTFFGVRVRLGPRRARTRLVLDR